jgi:putative transposase
VYITYRYRFYPSKWQAEYIDQKMEMARKTYNQLIHWYLQQTTDVQNSMRRAHSSVSGSFSDDEDASIADSSNEVPIIRNVNQHLIDHFLTEDTRCSLVDRTIVLHAIKTFDRNRIATQEHQGIMRFKSIDRKQSCTIYARELSLSIDGPKLHTTLLGTCSITMTRKPIGRLLLATFSRATSGKYYISLLMKKRDTQKNIRKTLSKQSIRIVGIDVGLSHYLTLSSGFHVKNPRFMDRQLKAIKRDHHRFSRAQPGSRNQRKKKRRLGVRYEHLNNQRKSFLHRLSTQLIKDYDVICIETLDIEGMKRQRRRSRQISDASWGQFIEMLTYKAKWNGKVIMKVPHHLPSSKLCCRCRYIKRDLTLSDRHWRCPHCQTEHDRDTNAAINVLIAGTKQLLRTYPSTDPKALKPALSDQR